MLKEIVETLMYLLIGGICFLIYVVATAPVGKNYVTTLSKLEPYAKGAWEDGDGNLSSGNSG